MTITQVSEKYDISADTLRYYEKIGLIPRVRRTQGGIRNYAETDCDWVGFIKCMRCAGIPVDALIEYVTLFQQGDATAEARKQILIKQRERLIARIAEMQETLERLNYKIDRYECMFKDIKKKLTGTES